jgi:16S rRNA (cytidine1402-2'-O)-methyltransferase
MSLQTNEIERGVLYVVPTPIGNMSDITPRAKETLENCDFLAAEDTRVSGKLLMLLGIKKPMVSYHEHNKTAEGKRICERIKSGETCALVTDAGTPAISDPGTELVALCAENGIKVISLPGACAAVTALAGSGMPSRRFCFEGFLPDNTSERREYLESIKLEKRTLIYYIAPHDLDKAITDLTSALGNRKCALAKELTKINEKYFYTTLHELPGLLEAAGASIKKGEFVLIVEGASEKADDDWKQLTVEEHITRYFKLGMTKMEACKAVARDRGKPKGEIYKVASEMNTTEE